MLCIGFRSARSVDILVYRVVSRDRDHIANLSRDRTAARLSVARSTWGELTIPSQGARIVCTSPTLSAYGSLPNRHHRGDASDSGNRRGSTGRFALVGPHGRHSLTESPWLGTVTTQLTFLRIADVELVNNILAYLVFESSVTNNAD